MKALKEKRISLRSLWRRGLVILSLFALVFASCGDSSSGDSGGDTTPAVLPTSISVLGTLANPSYEGQPVDLTGVEFLVKYDDGNRKTFTPGNLKYKLNPPLAVGAIGEDAAIASNYYWVPNRDYQLEVILDGERLTSWVTQVSVIPVVRKNSTAYAGGWTFKYSDAGDYYWSDGLQLTGDFGRTVYVDDNPKTNSFLKGLRLQANYADTSKQDIAITEDTNWEIRPQYNNGRGALGKTGKGDLILTIGDIAGWAAKTDFNNLGGGLISWNASNITTWLNSSKDADVPTLAYPSGLERLFDAGLTVTHPFDEVYHVKALAFDPAPQLDPFFYWDDDSSAAWRARLNKAGAKVKVTYSNDTTKSFFVDDMVELNNVWYNKTPFSDWENPADVQGIYSSTRVQKGSNITYTKHNKNQDPKIKLYYRGEFAELSVPVYTKFEGINAVFVSGDSLEVDMRTNDNDVGGRDATWFASQIKVTATYSAYSTGDTIDVELGFDEKLCDGNAIASTSDDGSGAGPADPDSVKYNSGVPWTVGVPTYFLPGASAAKAAKLYTMDFGKPSWRKISPPVATGNPPTIEYYRDYDKTADPDAPTYPNSPVEFLAFGQCDLISNSGRERPVTIYYEAPTGVEGAEYTSGTWNPNGDPTGLKNTVSKKTAKINVSWINIRS